ncbi:MAG: signal peptidase I [Planctomycetaceae bacterium]|nr:signal peptidase I [Planctomycetaceae bacterium]
MAKTKTETPPQPKPANQDSVRETFESIVVAFVLAFLFRTFIAEAFVIPTGSMAPTLFGRHKDVACPQCGYEYEVGASIELDEEGNQLLRRITRASCPNCQFEAPIKNLAVFKGDRILVNKFPYELGDPSRWDVCVFKFPENPERNYIKRLVGLPGEALRLSRGDVYARRGNEGAYQILRKDDPNKQAAIQIIVADDRQPPKKLLKQGWPERWTAMKPEDGPTAIAGWTENPDVCQADVDRRTYRVTAEDTAWLRYRHFIPTKLDWDSVEDGMAPTPNPRPQLITDYYAYNTFDLHGNDKDLFWVGDLTISGVVQVDAPKSDDAAIVLELVEGVRRYRCTIALKTGEATLTRTDDLNPDGPDIELTKATTPVRGAGKYRFQFANVDDRLCLWINSSLIPFGDAAIFPAAVIPDPQVADLSPVGLAVRHATATFSDLVLKRDIYYRAERVDNDDRGPLPNRLSDGEGVHEIMGHQLREVLSDPTEYARLYKLKASQPIDFAALQDDEFFVMGDNSPQSQDSRLWANRRGAVNRHAVPRNAMVGKAFLIYWPHGIPFLNDGQGYPIVWHSVPKNPGGQPIVENYPAYTAPFYPQFMRWLKRIR